MPIYDYRCDACGHAFSAVQSFTDDSLEACPQCGARPRKVLSSPAIVFKGSGWYKTDSRKGSAAAKADAKADGKSEGTSEGKSETVGEAKPAGAAPAAKAEPAAKAPAKQEPAS